VQIPDALVVVEWMLQRWLDFGEQVFLDCTRILLVEEGLQAKLPSILAIFNETTAEPRAVLQAISVFAEVMPTVSR